MKCCYNPFKLPKHTYSKLSKRNTSKLSPPQLDIYARYFQLERADVQYVTLCINCQFRFRKETAGLRAEIEHNAQLAAAEIEKEQQDLEEEFLRSPSISNEGSNEEDNNDEDYIPEDRINRLKRKLQNASRLTKSLNHEDNSTVPMSAKKLKFAGNKDLSTEPERCNSKCCQDLVSRFKEAFQRAESKHEKYKILTALPRCINIENIQKEFGCTKYMSRKAKRLRKTKGAFSFPDKRHSSNSSQGTLEEKGTEQQPIPDTSFEVS